MAKFYVYLHLRVRYETLANGNFKVRGISVDRITQSPPGEVTTPVVKLSLEIPDERLLPISVDARTAELDFSGEFKAVIETLKSTEGVDT